MLIARALAADPALLILDEPCAGLDPVARADFLELLTRLPELRRGMSVVLVTHHVEEVGPIFTHALMLRAGVKLAEGRVSELFDPVRLGGLFGRPVRLTKSAGAWRLDVR